MFALVEGNTITAVTGRLPTAARNQTTLEWVCPPDGLWTQAQHEACGWFVVVTVTPPTVTAAQVAERTVVLLVGIPTEQWTVRAKTAEELAADTANTNAATLLAGVAAEITRIETQIGLADIIAGSTTPKSVINADPGAYVKDLAKMVKRIGNASIRALRITGGRYESASVGDTT